MRRLLLAVILAALSSPALAANTDAGKYQVVLGDCEGCHGKNLAGGVALETPFGRMVTPNITPDKETGIGSYNLEAFKLAPDEYRVVEALVSLHVLGAALVTVGAAALWAGTTERPHGATRLSTPAELAPTRA